MKWHADINHYAESVGAVPVQAMQFSLDEENGGTGTQSNSKHGHRPPQSAEPPHYSDHGDRNVPAVCRVLPRLDQSGRYIFLGGERTVEESRDDHASNSERNRSLRPLPPMAAMQILETTSYSLPTTPRRLWWLIPVAVKVQEGASTG